jgi:ABC-type multidrug transport system fused ATPase/permease subunit
MIIRKKTKLVLMKISLHFALIALILFISWVFSTMNMDTSKLLLSLLGISLLLALIVRFFPSSISKTNKSPTTQQNDSPNPNGKSSNKIFNRWLR